MKKFRTTSYLTCTLKRISEIEAESAEDAEHLFNWEGERGQLISEEVVKLIGDEELEEVEEVTDSGQAVPEEPVTPDRLLAASRLWLRTLIEQTGVDPDKTEFTATANGPEGSRVLATVNLSKHLADLDAALGGETAG